MFNCRIVCRRWLLATLTLASLLVLPETLPAQSPRPSASDPQVVQTVKVMLERNHLTRRRVDDEISGRFYRNFLKEFDPAKIYFEQRDIDEFKKHELTLDEEVTQGDLGFAQQVFDRFLVRAKERQQLVEELVAAAHDFTAEEYLGTDYDKTAYTQTAEEVRDRWRKRIKYDLLLQRLDKKPLPEAEQQQKIIKRYRNQLRRWEQIDSGELLEMYLRALCTSFDPHSDYMSPSTLEDFNIVMRLHLDGIGAKLRSEDGYTIVAEIVAGGAADLDGRLKPGDKIVAVASDGEKIEDVVDMKLGDVVKKIRGKRDTPVLLRVIPAGKTEPVDYKLTRAEILLHEGEARSEIIEVGKKDDGQPYRLGIIELPSFYMDVAAANAGRDDEYKSSTRDVRDKLKAFEKSGGVDGVVIDLRNNGGGALREAIDLTGLFIDHGAVVQAKGSSDRVELYDDDRPGTAYSGPLMVLVSKLSASASEIFAGAIQDYGRGLIVGDDSTHGKGTVQTVVDLNRHLGVGSPQLGALKLTIQQFYRVNGDSTQNRGVIPDVVLPSLVNHYDIGEASLPQALPFSRVEPVAHANLGLITPDLRKQLQSLSVKRRQESADFQKLADDIERFQAIKSRKAITLNEEKRREEMKRGSTEEDAVPDPDQPRKRDTPVFERTYYNNEVLGIMEDFVRLGHHPRVASRL